MIDTHTHLYMEQYDGEQEAVVQRAFDAGLEHLVFPNVNAASVEPMIALADKFPGKISVCIGLHPSDVAADWQEQIDKMWQCTGRHDFRAVGEVGIDLYWDKTYTREQMLALENQVNRAIKADLPLVIHCRDGLDETIEVLSGFKNNLPQTVFHSFTGTRENVEKIRRHLDPLFGINGVVTFKNAPDLREALPEIGIDKIMLETDAPYLAPVPFRGRRNESAYLAPIRDKIAETLGITPQEVDRTTTLNAKKFFRIP